MKYDYMARMSRACDMFVWGIDSGATTIEELDIPALLAKGTDYHASLLPKVHPELIVALLKPKNSQGIKTFSIALRDYIEDLGRRIEQEQPLIGVFPTLPLELFYGLDVAALLPELFSLVIAATYKTGVEEELDASEIEGLPGHVCAFQKAPLMAFQKGLFPKPMMFVKTTAPCDSSNITMQYTAHQLGVPLYGIDSPYYSNRRAFKYFVDEIHRMIETIEKATGHTMDEDRLRQRVEWTNAYMSNLYKLFELRKNRPIPDPGMHRLLDLAALMMGGCSENLPKYSEVTYNEALERQQKGISFLPEGKKEIRTLWTGSMFPYALYLGDWVEDMYGSTYAGCGLTNLPKDVLGVINTSSVESMIEGLAWRTFNFPMHRTVMSHTDVYLNDMLTVAKEIGADAAIYAGNMGCKHSWTMPKLLSDAFGEELNIPTMTMEVDWVDGRFTPRDIVLSQLSEFFGTLA
ncbi:MAG: 2-hydroxyacyl-CoA dehydratase family protein [Desulfobacterales bacterium]|nr:2-hydroxyacyl-CoA dehydratase family protein [Desulfobacterales bacterium]